MLPTIWFIALFKLKEAPNPQEREAMNRMMDAAWKMGVAIHQGFVTLGQYDAVWISEAAGISGPMRMSMMHMENAHAEILVAVSYEDVMKRMKKKKDHALPLFYLPSVSHGKASAPVDARQTIKTLTAAASKRAG